MIGYFLATNIQIEEESIYVEACNFLGLDYCISDGAYDIDHNNLPSYKELYISKQDRDKLGVGCEVLWNKVREFGG